MPTKILKQAFAVYPSIKLKTPVKDESTGEDKMAFAKELLFGDTVKPSITDNKYEEMVVKENGTEVTYIKVLARNRVGYIKPEEIQEEQILEVNFVDVGQGDGCHIVTPDGKHYLIDAGPGDNLYRFLRWRFNLKNAEVPPPPFTVIISHSDADHYKGFTRIFSASNDTNQQFSITKVFHNGMIELSGSTPASLGKEITHNGDKYITELCETDAQYEKRVKNLDKPGQYVSTLEKTKAAKRSLKLGSEPVYQNGNMKVEVLAPVTQKINGEQALPVFDSNKGKTKNGHSVVLKLTIGKLRLLLGGDLNTESENYLLTHFSGTDITAIKEELKKKTTSKTRKEELQAMLQAAVQKARKKLEVDIAKSCHHGSADFTSEFLKALNPVATIISSGDDEPHTHPRPDTLGTIGKHSRGERSLIFCTELARSSKEFVEVAQSASPKQKERVVTVYGMINVRTDGEKVIIAQKLERPAAGRGWDIHKLEWNKESKEFEYIQYLKYDE